MYTIEFNSQISKFQAISNGNVVAESPNLQYLKSKMRARGVQQTPSDNTPIVLTSAPVAEVRHSEFSVQERFDFIKRFTTGVASGAYSSMIITGEAGVGKSYTVVETLQNLGLQEVSVREDEDGNDEVYGDFIVIKGFSTPKALYRTLYENNGKIIIIDDADGIFKDSNAANILKGALDLGDKRVISWGAERSIGGDDALPMRFNFTGRVIFISNLSLKQFPQALISRSVSVDLTFTFEEKVEHIERIMSQQDNTNNRVTDVMALIKEHGQSFKELSLRKAMILLKMRDVETDPAMFRKMALYNAKH